MLKAKDKDLKDNVLGVLSERRQVTRPDLLEAMGLNRDKDFWEEDDQIDLDMVLDLMQDEDMIEVRWDREAQAHVYSPK